MAQLARMGTRRRVTMETTDKEELQLQQQWVVDDATLSSVIANGEDVGPIIRTAFARGKPEVLLHQVLRVRASSSNQTPNWTHGTLGSVDVTLECPQLGHATVLNSGLQIGPVSFPVGYVLR